MKRLSVLASVTYASTIFNEALQTRATDDIAFCLRSAPAPYQDCYELLNFLRLGTTSSYYSGIPERHKSCQVTYYDNGYGGYMDKNSLADLGEDIIKGCWTQTEINQNAAKAGKWDMTFGTDPRVVGLVCLNANGSPSTACK